MESATLERIEQLVLQAHSANRLSTHIPALILNDTVTPIENLQPQRSRFRGTFKTSILDDFAHYVNEHGGACFIDPNTFSAKNYVNLGDEDEPGHGDWTANLTLVPTAGYAALSKMDGAPQEQRALAEWIEDWAEFLSAHMSVEAAKTGDAIPLSTAVQSIREITIATKRESTNHERDFGATRSAMEEIEAKAKAGLPTHFVFHTVPYVGFQERAFPMRLSVITGDKPRVVLRLVNGEQIKEDLLTEFRSILGVKLGDEADIAIGSFSL